MKQPELDLPITKHLDEILSAVRQHPVVLLASPPGTGKTTILPPFLVERLESSLQGLRVALLEPRRIATVRAAEFIAERFGPNPKPLGELIGYRVRGSSMISARTLLEVQTYGVFNRIAASSIDLADYGVVIFDEAHERSIDIDLALAQALEIQSSIRPDLKIVVMSATLNVEDLKRVVPNAPLITVETESFPVDISYLPPQRNEERDLSAHLVRAARAVSHREGDILVFLPGGLEIERASQALEAAFRDREVTALFGDLSLKEQRAILSPSQDSARRFVLATAIAETSVTVPRVHTVIDCGLSRVPRYDPERGVSGLETVRVSSSTAHQRAGRAGRLGPGVCLRLWPEHEQLVRFRSPEILESDLAPLILTLASAGVTSIEGLRWMTQPMRGSVEGAKALLRSLSALDSEGRITPHGTALQALPLHPRLANILLFAQRLGHQELGLKLVALWSEMRPAQYTGLPDLEALAQAKPFGSSRELEAQLERAMPSKPAPPVKFQTKPSVALLFAAGFPDRIAHAREDGVFLLSSGMRASLPAGSALSREDWLVCPAVRARGGSATGTISVAGSISEELLLSNFPELFTASTETVWSSTRKAVVTRRAESLLAISLSSNEAPYSGNDAAEILLRHVVFGDLPLGERGESLIARVRWLALRSSDDADKWSGLSKIDSGDLTWLTDFIPGATRLSEIDPQAVAHGLINLFGGARSIAEVDRLAPESLTLPRGRTVKLAYSPNKAPVASSRLQDFFGVRVHPTICNGSVRVICELLSPARRPVQVTDDLPRFWTGSYAEVRKELKARYPKHDWPLNP